MNRRIALPWALFALALSPKQALAWELFRSESSAVERGNEHLAKGQQKEALEAYEEAARELPNDPGVQLDRGLALLALGKLGEAREAFRRAASGNAPKELRGPALYDLGLAFLREGEQAAGAEDFDGAKKMLQEAVDAFKGSLRAQPGSRDAAWNLELAKRRLADVQQKQEQKKKDEEEKKKNEPKKDQPENKDEQDKQDSEPKQPEGDAGTPKPRDEDGGAPRSGGDAGGEPEPEQEKGDRDGGAPPPPTPSQGDAGAPEPEPAPSEPRALPEHMERALDALEAGEENLEKFRAKQRARSRPRRIEKDW